MTSGDPRQSVGETLAFLLSCREVRDCVNSLRAGKDDWRHENGWHRTRPYPMGFYPNDPNLYYARGWGMHHRMFPWERWLVRRAQPSSARPNND